MTNRRYRVVWLGVDDEEYQQEVNDRRDAFETCGLRASMGDAWIEFNDGDGWLPWTMGYEIETHEGEMNATEVAFVDDAPATDDDYEAQVVTGEGETVADLRAAFDAVADDENWKNPISAAVEAAKVGRVTRAVTFFHADVPSVVGMEAGTGKLILEGHGYSA